MNICAKLINFLKNIIFSPDFSHRHRNSNQDFIRSRKLPFPSLLIFLLNLIKGSLQDELDNFFKVINHQSIATREISKSAFSQARKKLKHTAFIELNHSLIDFFYRHFAVPDWCGFRLLAVDGSTLKIPTLPELINHFGRLSQRVIEDYCLARVSQLFDVQNKVTLHSLIKPLSFCERSALVSHLEHVSTNDLLLLDRGYPAFWVFALLSAKKINVCARIKSKQWEVVRKFYLSGKQEDLVTFDSSPQSKRQCQKLGLSPDSLQLRLIRVELSSGETEILVTSLIDQIKYPHNIFRDLYHQRWPVEEDYKAMKHRIQIENFSGKSLESVYQDFHAKIFAKNLTAILSLPAKNEIKRQALHKKHCYQINFTQALSKMKDTIIILFSKENVFKTIKAFFDLIVKTFEPVRPERKYDRKKKPPKRFFLCYKPVR